MKTIMNPSVLEEKVKDILTNVPSGVTPSNEMLKKELIKQNKPFFTNIFSTFVKAVKEKKFGEEFFYQHFPKAPEKLYKKVCILLDDYRVVEQKEAEKLAEIEKYGKESQKAIKANFFHQKAIPAEKFIEFIECESMFII